MQTFRKFLSDNWESLALYGSLFAVLGTALYWRLGSLLPGYSQPELDTYNDSLSVGNLLENPLNAPFLLLVRVLLFINPDSLLATRIAATVFGLGILALFCWLVRSWHDDKTAIMGTLLFGLSAWFLHAARMGTPEILATGVFALFACGFWLTRSKSWYALLACFILAAVLLYVPGMVWFVLAGIAWQWKTIDYIFKSHLLTVSLGGLLLLAALAPLGWAIYQDMGLLTAWLGLPSTWPNIVEVGKNLLAIPYHLAVANNAPATTWLGKAPVLDAFSVAALVVGGYLYLRHKGLLRTPIIVSLIVLGVVLVALGGPVSLGVLMPFLYLIIASGIGYLLNLWLRVFPRNPIARSIGTIMLVVVLAIACAFHIRHYFIGWPEARATHDAYTIQKP